VGIGTSRRRVRRRHNMTDVRRQSIRKRPRCAQKVRGEPSPHRPGTGFGGRNEHLDVTRIERLGQIRDGAVAQRLGAHLVLLRGADHDDRQARLDLADLLEQREAVHARHLEVEQDHVRALAHHRVQALATVGHRFDLQGLRVTHRADDVRERLPDVGLVVHDKYASRRHCPGVTVHLQAESRPGRFAIKRSTSVSWWGFSLTGRIE